MVGAFVLALACAALAFRTDLSAPCSHVLKPVMPSPQEEARAMYAVGIGVIVVLIRKYGSYPEGVTYAILLMNIAGLLFDRIPIHRIYGHAKAKREGK